MNATQLPQHLRRYVVEQDYKRYTNIDQAVWRFIMRRLREYLSNHAHECYRDGLEKAGISVEEIPRIDVMSEKLATYGWEAIAVSGFIPPVAFMELQSLNILPIACDMRALEHAMYTPAPDIVHEAAGHAPILIHPEFSLYLHEYAQISKKAIINKEDLEIYEAIRILSDLKEDPNSTDSQIEAANQRLQLASQKAKEPSEAALLARMNWWTAEYGLIGDIQNPKIYGAGLLSSVGESITALQGKTKKIPFSLKCIDFAYDITEPQPQLFVTPSFDELTIVLHEMANTMAFRLGGLTGLLKAQKAGTVNTAELNSGIQISGRLKNFISSKENKDDIIYLQFEGPSQLSHEELQLKNHGTDQHPHGFGTPVGKLKGASKCLSDFSENDLKDYNIKLESMVTLCFESGVVVEGFLNESRYEDEKLILLRFSKCTVTYQNQVLFDPSWGDFDMAVGSKIISVFGGAADREAYGETEDFIAKRVIPPTREASFIALNELFGQIRNLRNSYSESLRSQAENSLMLIINRLNKDFPKEWLARLEVLEICVKHSLNPIGLESIQSFIASGSNEPTEEGHSLREGLRLIEKGI